MIIKENKHFFKLLLFCVVFLTGATSLAAFSNYNSILIGDMNAGMGGTGTAVVGDVSSSSFYNPALLGRLSGEAFSATVGIFKKYDTIYGEQQDFTQAPFRVNQGFFRSLPASTGSVISWKNFKLGLSIIVPDYDTFKGDLRKDTTDTSSMSFTDESLWVGGSVAHSFSETESAGFTMYYTARSYVRTINDRSTPSATQSTIYNQDKNLTENALVFVLGYYNQLNKNWGLGLSYRPPSIRVAGAATINESKTFMDTAGPVLSVTEPIIPSMSAPAKIPSKLALGISYSPNANWLWATDITFYDHLSYNDVGNETYATKVDTNQVLNASFGGQWAIKNWLKLRGGVFTNFSSHPNPNPDIAQFQEDRVDMLGFSANFLFIAKNEIGYTFGGYYTGGRGRSIQRYNQKYEVVTKTQNVFTMLVGTHLNF